MAIRISMGHMDEYNETVATFAKQLGLSTIQLHAPTNLPGHSGFWTVEELQALQAKCTLAGLSIEGLENVPFSHFNKIQQGSPGRDEQLENYHRTIRNMGQVGIDLLGYNFIASYVWRTDMGRNGRGGARVTSFDLNQAYETGNALASYKLAPDEPILGAITAEQMWDNYQYFLDATLPVAEEAGVRLALHPDDPPVE